MVYQLAEQDADILAKFSVSTEGEKGVLTLTKPLDFEEKSLYQVSQFCQVPMKSMPREWSSSTPSQVIVEARDRASQGEVNTAQATILVQVTLIIVTIAIPIMIR